METKTDVLILLCLTDVSTHTHTHRAKFNLVSNLQFKFYSGKMRFTLSNYVIQS